MNWPAPILRRYEREERAGWHLWWAWFPVRIGTRWHWLERVKRRVEFCDGYRIVAYRDVEWRLTP